MIKPIITNKDQLKVVSQQYRYGETQPPLDKILDDMIDTVRDAQKKPLGCSGLAANQIGYLYRIILIWHGSQWIPMINPNYDVRPGKSKAQYEMCLSRPGVRKKMKRHKKIKLFYWDTNEDLIEWNVTGFTARVIQHEIDHLDGVYI